MQTILVRSLLTLFLVLYASVCQAFLIRGEKGNKLVNDPGWPMGAAKVFNTGNRVAWWEGPPFGGGQWHAECQGNAEALNAILVDFQNIDAPKKRLIVHDGVGRSFWLDPNREQTGNPTVEIDWMFIVWQKDRWEMQKKLPAGMSSIRRGIGTADPSPIPEIHFYAGGAIDWKDLKVPDGIEVIDNRLESHGFSRKDGRVIDGTALNLHSGMPIEATIRIEKIESNPKGGYIHSNVATTVADDKGHWQFKNVGTDWYRVIAEYDGFVPRLLTHVQYTQEPGWEKVEAKLARATKVRGRVIDSQGKPLQGVEVRFSDVAIPEQEYYEQPDGASQKSDENGCFEIESVTGANCRVWVHRDGYVRPGLGQTLTIPCDEVTIQMEQASSLTVEVVFDKQKTAANYLVHIGPEGGEKVGSWGGSGNIDAENKIQFKNIPPGKYVIHGRPNPGSDDEQTQQKIVDLEPGKELKITIAAK